MREEGIRPEKILRELDELWVSLGKQESGESSAGVLRACAMTLMVAAEGSDDEAEVGEMLAALMRDHPSRAIVLRLVPGEQEKLEARVRAQCWMPFGSRQQICCEQIEITMTERSLADVPPVVWSLIAPDLPVAIWVRSRRLLAMESFQAVMRLASKVIVDSDGEPDIAGQIRLIRQAGERGQQVADLAWTRLTRWRESVARAFDNPAYLGRLPGIRKVSVQYEGDHIPMSAWYLAGWLENSLERELEIDFRKAGEAARARVRELKITGEDLDVSITAGQDEAVELREELGLVGRDRIYDGVVERVSEIAGQGRERS